MEFLAELFIQHKGDGVVRRDPHQVGEPARVEYVRALSHDAPNHIPQGVLAVVFPVLVPPRVLLASAHHLVRISDQAGKRLAGDRRNENVPRFELIALLLPIM